MLKTPLLTLFEREENTPGTPVDIENEDSEENSEKTNDDRFLPSSAPAPTPAKLG